MIGGFFFVGTVGMVDDPSGSQPVKEGHQEDAGATGRVKIPFCLPIAVSLHGNIKDGFRQKPRRVEGPGLLLALSILLGKKILINSAG